MPTRDRENWISIRGLCAVLDISDAHFRKEVLPFLQEAWKTRESRKGQRGGHRWLLDPRPVLDWYYTNKVFGSRRGRARTADSGVDLDDDDYDESEDYRPLVEHQKWRKLKRENELAERQILNREEVHNALGEVASILREVGRDLQNQFGVEAYDLLEEKLTEVEGRVAELCRGRVVDQKKEAPKRKGSSSKGSTSKGARKKRSKKSGG